MSTVVNVTLPPGKSVCQYGAAHLGVAAGELEVPAYVATSLVAAGASCPDLPTGSAATLLDSADAGEALYICMAYGTMFDPNTDMLAKAKQLMQSRGEPAVQFA
jgi:hypothetical protein